MEDKTDTCPKCGGAIEKLKQEVALWRQATYNVKAQRDGLRKKLDSERRKNVLSR